MRVGSRLSGIDLTAQHNLLQSYNQLNLSSVRLSTMQRINKASDDPAGLIAVEDLRAELTAINAATDNGLARAAELLEMSLPEVKNRATITGAIEIGRNPGVVQVTFRAPLDRLEARGLLPFIRDQYGIG